MDDKFATLTQRVRDRLADEVTAAADAVVKAVLDAAPAYGELFGTDKGEVIRGQIEIALRTYLKLSEHGLDPTDASVRQSLVRPATEAAFLLGRNEAGFGRGTETLLTAFRVGARTTWKAFAGILTSCGVSAVDVADFAEQLFDFIDQLSAAAVAGHEFHSARESRLRETERDLLVRDVLQGREPGTDRLARAEWSLPTTVTVLVATDVDMRHWVTRLPAGSLSISGDLPEPLELRQGMAAAIVPDLTRGTRSLLCARLDSERVALGPLVPTGQAPTSYRWAALLARQWSADEGLTHGGLVDAIENAVDVLLAAEPGVAVELRHRYLEPLSDLPPATRERLEETLRSWLDHRGRHDLVAAAMHVHPQTVRYRIGQIQDLIGTVLADPAQALGLRIALAGPVDVEPHSTP